MPLIDSKMRNSEFLKGVQIISSKMPEERKDKFDLHAEHDQIWFGDAQWITDPLDIKTLEELGWFIDEDSWSCFP